MNSAHAIVKRQSRIPTEKQRRRIDEMRRKIENFRFFQGILRHNILDILKVPTRSDVDENNT